jgi:hypothetical protein
MGNRAETILYLKLRPLDNTQWVEGQGIRIRGTRLRAMGSVDHPLDAAPVDEVLPARRATRINVLTAIRDE